MVWVRFFFYFPFVAWLARWIMMTFVVWLGRCSQFIPLDPLEQARNAWLALWEENCQFFGTFRVSKKMLMHVFFWGCYVSNINWFVAERLIDLTFWRPRYDAQLRDDSSMFLIGLYAYIYTYTSMLHAYLLLDSQNGAPEISRIQWKQWKLGSYSKGATMKIPTWNCAFLLTSLKIDSCKMLED